eukprot:c16557_g1_i2.p1 GENE.c16557_g1_i2~~c16557_g1_i2.p1  ORF type:complete len:819 (-),score=174.17 c16557_g1_i2:634-3090(-)
MQAGALVTLGWPKDSNQSDKDKPVQVSLTEQAEALACGANHTAVVSVTGQLWTFGSGIYGALGHGDSQDVSEPKLVAALRGKRISSVACGTYHTICVSDNGSVYSMGWGNDGQLAAEDNETLCLEPGPVAIEPTKLIACGYQHSLALTYKGQVFAWGNNRSGQLGLGTSDDKAHHTPKLVAKLTEHSITFIACGGHHSAAIDARGRLFVWGGGVQGQLGVLTPGQDLPPHSLPAPTLVPPFADEGLAVESVSLGEYHTAVVTQDGELYTFGLGSQGRLGHRSELPQFVPSAVTSLKEHRIALVACGFSHTVVLTDDGKMFGFGESPIGASSGPKHISALSHCHVGRIACGDGFTAAVIAPDTQSSAPPSIADSVLSKLSHRSRVAVPEQKSNGVRPDPVLSDELADVIVSQQKALETATTERDAFKSEATQLSQFVEQLERNNLEAWEQNAQQSRRVEEVVGACQVEINKVVADVHDVKSRILEQVTLYEKVMAQQHTSSDAISENITALVATVASHHSGLSTTLTTVAENVAITRQQIEFQNAQHAKDKELLSGVIKDLTNASQIADKEKEQLWEQARGSKDALSKALGDEAAARQRAAIADEEVAAVKQKLRDMTTEHSQVVAALKQQMVREREDSEEVLKTFKAKSQRLSEELEAVKEQLSQAHVDNQIMARKLEKVEEDAKAAIETAQTTAAAMSEEARLARAEADQLRKESVFVTSQLTETHAKLAATESELKTTAKDKHVLAHVMRDVEARHKQAVDKVEAEKDAILQQKHGVMRELEDARAIIQAKKKVDGATLRTNEGTTKASGRAATRK